MEVACRVLAVKVSELLKLMNEAQMNKEIAFELRCRIKKVYTSNVTLIIGLADMRLGSKTGGGQVES